MAAKHKYLDKVGWEGEQALRINQEMEVLRDRIPGLLKEKGGRNNVVGRKGDYRWRIGRIGGILLRG